MWDVYRIYEEMFKEKRNWLNELARNSEIYEKDTLKRSQIEKSFTRERITISN